MEQTKLARRHWPLPVYFLFAYLALVIVFGKGPTYIGKHPLYWGELTLALGLFWMILPSARQGLSPSYPRKLALIVLLFMIEGGLLLLGDLMAGLGVDAIREGVDVEPPLLVGRRAPRDWIRG
jgi:hypothetical protein